MVIENGRFSWDGYDCPPILHNVNVNVKAGALVAVVGSVGSGKSSLLSAILGEMYLQAGHVNTTVSDIETRPSASMYDASEERSLPHTGYCGVRAAASVDKERNAEEKHHAGKCERRRAVLRSRSGGVRAVTGHTNSAWRR